MMKAIAWCCAVALVAGAPGVGAQESIRLGTADWGPASDGLRMTMQPVASASGPGDPHFYIALQNAGDSDVVINLGYMTANGRVMFPNAIQLFLTGPQGATRELQYVDRRYPGIEGRLDDFVVALRMGSVHAIRVSLDHYRSSATNEFGIKLERGRYHVEAHFHGQGAQSLNRDTPGIALFNFWKGTLRSNSLAFEIS
jgi:hypothetical protein